MDIVHSAQYQTTFRPNKGEAATWQATTHSFNELCGRVVKADYFEKFVYHGIEPEISIISR